MVALSSCEAEYIAAAMGTCQALWLKMVLDELGVMKTGAMKIMVDNKSAISLADHPVAHGRSKHIDTKYHFLRDRVNKGNVILDYCGTDEQLADILTKALNKSKLEELRSKLNVTSCANLN